MTWSALTASPGRFLGPWLTATDRSAARRILAALTVGLAYYVSGYYGIAAKVPPAGIAAVWPPGAILLAALLLTPRNGWWQILAVVVPVHVVLFLQCVPDMTAPTMAFQTVGYVAQALLAAEWLRRLEGLPPRFEKLRSVTNFVLVGALAAPALVSAVIVYVYTLTGWVDDFWAVWRQRLLANMVALVTVTPLIVVTVSAGRDCIRRTTFARYTEFAVLMLAMCAVVAAVSGWEPTSYEALPALLYALLPLLIWAAVRFEPGGLYAGLLLTGFGSLFGAYHGRGPFLTLSQPENVLALQLFLLSVAIPMMLLAALVQERGQTANALRESQTRYTMATAAGSSGVWDWNLKTGDLYLDPALKALLGYQDHEIGNTMTEWAAHVHADDQALVREATRDYMAGASTAFEVEHRALHKDGSVRWLLCRGVTTERADGEAVRMVGTDTDITERKVAERAVRNSHERIREMAGRLISAQEEERRRIARDLHDDLNQKVAGLSIGLSNVKQRIPASEKHLIRELGQLQSRTADLVQDIRELSHDIHPAILEHGGLAPALTAFAAELKQLEDFDLRVTLPDPAEDLPPRVTIAIYRIAQESIRNVLRHAGTRRAEIALSRHNDSITLVVSDRGRGFDPAHAHENGGLGLISIEERVRLLNGRLEVSSEPGVGTTLRVEVPLAVGVLA